MSITTWNTNPALNVSINGIDISENCPPGNMNNMGREIMAGVAQLRDSIPSTAGFAPLASPAFTGTPTLATRGAVRHNVDASLTSGREYFLLEGSTAPTGLVVGDVVNYYT